MTSVTIDDEIARKIAGAIDNIDGGCPVCSGRFADDLAQIIPEWDWRALVDEMRWSPLSRGETNDET